MYPHTDGIRQRLFLRSALSAGWRDAGPRGRIARFAGRTIGARQTGDAGSGDQVTARRGRRSALRVFVASDALALVRIAIRPGARAMEVIVALHADRVVAKIAGRAVAGGGAGFNANAGARAHPSGGAVLAGAALHAQVRGGVAAGPAGGPRAVVVGGAGKTRSEERRVGKE